MKGPFKLLTDPNRCNLGQRPKKMEERKIREEEERGNEAKIVVLWGLGLTDKSDAPRRAFARIYTPSLVAKKEKEEEQLVGAMDDNSNMRTRSCTNHTLRGYRR